MPELNMDQHLNASLTDQKIKLFSKRFKRTRDYIACGQHRQGLNTEPSDEHTDASSGDITSDVKMKQLHSTSDVTFTPRLLQRDRSWAVVDVSNLKSKKLHSQSAVDIHNLHKKDDAIHNRLRKLSTKVGSAIGTLLPSPPSTLPGMNNVENNKRPKSSAQSDALKSPSMSTLASRSYSSFREEPLYQDAPKQPRRPNTSMGNTRKGKMSTGSVPDITQPISRPRTAMREPSIKSRISGNTEKVLRPKTATEGKGAAKYRSWADFFKQRDSSKKPKTKSNQQDTSSATRSPNVNRRKALKNQIVTQRAETYQNLRTRSPSPGYSTNRSQNRSRSLSSRNLDTSNRPPSGRHKKGQERDTSASRCSSTNSRTRQRRSSVPYVKWKQNTEKQARNSPSEGMNGESLPPLQSNRSESALSKKSSRESLLSAGSSIPRGSVLKHEKPVLISIDDHITQGNPMKRSHLSPASANSGSSNNSKGNGSIPRNRSWATLDSTAANKAAQLETLFEQKGHGHSSISQDINGEGPIAESAIDSGYNSSKSRNMKNQIREQRRGSLVASSVNTYGKISPGKRTQSVSNITNPSENSTGRDEVSPNANKSGKKELPRIRSENTLSVPQTALKGPSSPRGTTQNQSLRTANGKSFNRTKSQPALMQNDSELNEKNLQRNMKKQGKQKIKDNNNIEEQDESNASEGEKNNRIVEWLIGVQSAERPPTPEIVEEEEPPQTDTAIHVVYNGER